MQIFVIPFPLKKPQQNQLLYLRWRILRGRKFCYYLLKSLFLIRVQNPIPKFQLILLTLYWFDEMAQMQKRPIKDNFKWFITRA